MNKLLNLFIAALLLLSLFPAAVFASLAEFDINEIDSYKSIPGVTVEEIMGQSLFLWDKGLRVHVRRLASINFKKKYCLICGIMV